MIGIRAATVPSISGTDEPASVRPNGKGRRRSVWNAAPGDAPEVRTRHCDMQCGIWGTRGKRVGNYRVLRAYRRAEASRRSLERAQRFADHGTGLECNDADFERNTVCYVRGNSHKCQSERRNRGVSFEHGLIGYDVPVSVRAEPHESHPVPRV